MKPLISFAITVKDEVEEFALLVDFLRTLLGKVGYTFEIVVLKDGEGGSYAHTLLRGLPHRLASGDFGGDFGAWKNFLGLFCRGEYVFQIDADELPPERVLLTLDYILTRNSGIDLFYFPRLNVVRGITDDDLRTFGWKAQIVPGFDLPVIAFPDYQGRLYRNNASIRWIGQVHERVDGYRGCGFMGGTPETAFLHFKSIARQRAQNERYRLMMSPGGSS